MSVNDYLTQLQTHCDNTQIKRQELTQDFENLERELEGIDKELFLCKIHKQEQLLKISHELDSSLDENVDKMLSDIEKFNVPSPAAATLEINEDTSDESLQIMNTFSNTSEYYTKENIAIELQKVNEEMERLITELAEYADNPQSTEAYKNKQQQILEQKRIDVKAQEIKLEEFKLLVAKQEETLKELKDEWEQSQKEMDKLQQ